MEETGKIREIVFGYAERRRSNAEPKSVEELHAMIRDGALFGPLNQKLDILQETVQMIHDREVGASSPSLQTSSLLDGRIGLALSELELAPTSPFYILAAAPLESIEIADLFTGTESRVVQLLQSPPELRSSGFDLNPGETARIVAGERRRVLRKKYKALNLWRDGTLVFAAEGEFLCWGSPPGRLRINQLALIESAYLFCELVCQIYAEAKQHPKATLFRLEIRNMTANNIPAGLIPGPLGTFAMRFGTDIADAPESGKKIDIEWRKEIKPGAVAYQLVKELYIWFAIEEKDIPYTQGAGTDRMISAKEIIEKNKSPF